MPYDITACNGENYPIKDECLRFTGVFYERYYRFSIAPYNFSKKSCESFLSDKPSQLDVEKLAYEFWANDGYQYGKDLDYWLKAETYLIEMKRKR
jgi:hypothetical protein